LIRDIVPAEELVRRIVAEAEETPRGTTKLLDRKIPPDLRLPTL
jgi:hypothetical protein